MYKLVVFVCFICVGCSYSQSQNIESYLNNSVASIPNSSGDNYVVPTKKELISWNNAITSLLNGAISTARLIADSIHYEINEFQDDDFPNELFYIVEEQANSTKYWGTYVFNLSACRSNLVLQAPHPKYDSKTGSEAIYCFKRLSAKALFLSGTHRCNHSLASSCSGTTGACDGVTQAFRVSDMAHNDSTFFQQATKAVITHAETTIFIQLHGFSKKSTDPYVIISNGTRTTPVIDYAIQIQNELETIDNTLTFKLAHIDLTWNRLIAFTNTQGRFLNESSNPCAIAATISSGKFVHIEQEKSKLRQDSIGWNKMYVALSNVFACITTKVGENKKDFVLLYPNPTQNFIEIKANNIQKIQLFDIRGSLLLEQNYLATSAVTLNLKEWGLGVYFIKIQTNNSLIVKKVLVAEM